MPKTVVLLACAAIALGQGLDPAYTQLDQAYSALRAKNYDAAVAGFERSIALAPDRPSIRKDLGYTLLKIGENDAAREQFAAAMRLDPGDENIALEYAFLCYEAKQEVTARRIFDRFRKTNATAAQAFENIDRPLREGIARWKQALGLQPDQFSGHLELARLAEQRDELELAAEQYSWAWRLRPERREVLVDMARIWRALGRTEDAAAALLAASRSSEPRLAEEARELLPARYPYVSEFEKALALDPGNLELRRELGFLQLELKQNSDAEKQFAGVLDEAPTDLLAAAQLGLLRMQRGDDAGAMELLNRVLAGDDAELAGRVREALHLPPVLSESSIRPARAPGAAKQMGSASLEKGYLKDALRYLTAAHEDDQLDFDVILKLGWANNLLKNDADAVKWFGLARRSPDAVTANEASKAYRNLEPSLRRIRTTVWMFPTFSSRWHDVFTYAQTRTELRVPGWWLKPYASVRFVGDTQGAVSPGSGLAPQYLSEGAATVGAGLATPAWRGITGWFEAGTQIRYRGATSSAPNADRISADYRGGASYSKGFGHLLTPGARGLFAETNDDAVYVSRFENDTLAYSQNRAGFTLPQPESGAGVHAQLYWNWNVTTDVKRLYWANSIETGPGIKFQIPRWPVVVSISALRGEYLVNTGNPRGPKFTDVRVGVWYALSR